ncbi:hypothetical protein LTR56_020106 [Elasticomyces elasticus]|nr:hypothetical protein LTR56_020106 [Elasticomyces elasticus]KAK3633869.1 hypothetical protein LTR22_019944 [Elasticomyces elasticus]KAK4910977.1 hypothetical protein LTR49_020422 [Elasticomyces elasticus]
MDSHPDNAQALAKIQQSNTLHVDVPTCQSSRSGNTNSPSLMTVAQELRDLVYDFAIRDSGKPKLTIDNIQLTMRPIQPFNVTTYIHFDDGFLASIRTIVLDGDWMIIYNNAFANLPNLDIVFLGPGPYTSRISMLSGWQSDIKLYYGDGPPPLMAQIPSERRTPALMNNDVRPGGSQ